MVPLAPSFTGRFPNPDLLRRLSVRSANEFNAEKATAANSSNCSDFNYRAATWKSSCAILASNVKIGGLEENIAADLGLLRVDRNRIPKPLTLTDPLRDGSNLRVAYQGVPGAYSEAAAGKAYPNCDLIPCDQFEAVFQAVEVFNADLAILPVENSLGGSIHRNYDLLLRHQLYIVGEVQIPVHHCLLALPGVRMEYLTRVISHTQALSQCEQSLTDLGLKINREAVHDTAGAAEFVAANRLRDTAAIASARAAKLYGLEILADGIQDDSGNVTRFMILSREPIIPKTDRPFKTSIVFAHDGDEKSILFKVLSAFAFRNINLTKIESRPRRNRRVADGGASAPTTAAAKYFEYTFYVDFDASMAEIRAQKAVLEVQEFTSFLRVLGSYPMDVRDPMEPLLS